MKKRILTVLLAIVTVTALTGCSGKKEMSSVVRDVEATTDGMVYIDDEAVALASSVESENMTEAQRARAQELKQMAEDAFALINAEREEGGLTALEWDIDLEGCSMVRAQECATKFSHTRPNGTDWWTVNSDLMWGENLAKGYSSAASVVEAWMNSKGHRANIMTAGYRTASIAIYEPSANSLYFALEFGY